MKPNLISQALRSLSKTFKSRRRQLSDKSAKNNTGDNREYATSGSKLNDNLAKQI